MFAGAGEPVGWGQSEAAKELRMKPRLGGGGRRGGGEGEKGSWLCIRRHTSSCEAGGIE